MSGADRPATRLATRLAFLVAGFGIACWAPLVPFAKARLAVNDGILGLVLLCLGTGSVLAMLMTGVLSARYGSKPIIVSSGVGISIVLPLLTITLSPFLLGLSLFAFGACLGSLDVAMNIHAVEVERAAKRPLMSGFHALYSVGGFAGSLAMTFLLSVHLQPLHSCLLCALLMLAAMAVAWPRLLRQASSDATQRFMAPRGIVLLLAALTGITFLVEGAILDWGALLITRAHLVAVAQGGLGYMVFSVAMTLGRLSGDAIVARVGDRTTVTAGSLISILGFLILVLAPAAAAAMVGFALIGLGASNIVPVLFRRAGSQSVMPVGLAVAAITTSGYAGVLLGPALVGWVANLTGLRTAFCALAVLLASVTLSARRVTQRRADGSAQSAAG